MADEQKETGSVQSEIVVIRPAPAKLVFRILLRLCLIAVMVFCLVDEVRTHTAFGKQSIAIAAILLTLLLILQSIAELADRIELVRETLSSGRVFRTIVSKNAFGEKRFSVDAGAEVCFVSILEQFGKGAHSYWRISTDSDSTEISVGAFAEYETKQTLKRFCVR